MAVQGLVWHCLLIFSILGEGSSGDGRIRYCNGVVEISSREDESEASCRWTEELATSFVPVSCSGGLVCDAECVPYSDWCSNNGTEQKRSCGAMLRSYALCRNASIWAGHQCGGGNLTRCTGWYPGRCTEHDCPDDTNQTDLTKVCLSPLTSSLVTMTGISYTCRDKFPTDIPICANRCNRVKDGCWMDEDEVDCAPGGYTGWLILLVAVAVTVTILTTEMILTCLQVDAVKEYELELECKANLLKEEEMVEHVSKLADLLFNKENWTLGELDESSILAPVWPPGGFERDRQEEVQHHYNSIRSSINPNVFSTLIHYTHARCDFQLTHYTLQHVYRVLEPDYISSNLDTVHSTNVDINIKKLLPAYEASVFYGAVFPYFDIVRVIKKILPSRGFSKRIIFATKKLIASVPEQVKYTLVVALSIISFYMDFIKDIFIASKVSFLYSSGDGLTIKNVIVITLWVTVFLSQVLIGMKVVIMGPNQLFGVDSNSLSTTKKFLLYSFLIVFCPIAPALLLFLNARIKRQMRLWDKQFAAVAADPVSSKTGKQLLEIYTQRRNLLDKRHKLERTLARSYQLDIALENTPQILVQVLIVLVAALKWRFDELSGVEAVFDYHDSTSQLKTFVFYFSIALSLRSIHSGMLSVFLFKKHYSLGDYGKILIFCILMISCMLRIYSIVLAFAPFLGLFGIMSLHQTDTRLTYSAQVWEEFKDVLTLSQEPTWYTGVSFQTVLVILFLFPSVHVLLMILLKMTVLRRTLTSISPRIMVSLLLHCFTTLISPVVYQDWDEMEGRTSEDFQSNWTTVKMEYAGMMVIHVLGNLVLGLPVMLTSARNLQRLAAMPMLDEEYTVYYLSVWFLFTPLLLVVLAVLQFKLFIMYNKNAHPWSILFKKASEVEK